MVRTRLLVGLNFVIGILSVLLAGFSGAGGLPAEDQAIPWLAVPALLGAGALGALVSATIPGWLALAGGVAVADLIGLMFAAGMADMYAWPGWYGTLEQIVIGIGLVLMAHFLGLTAGFAAVAALRYRALPAWSLRRRLLVAAPAVVFAAMAGLAPVYVAGSLPDSPRLKVNIAEDLSLSAAPAALPGREIEIDFGDWVSPATLMGLPLQSADELDRVLESGEVVNRSVLTLGHIDGSTFHRQSVTLPSAGWYAMFASEGSTTPPGDRARYALVHITP